MVLSIIFLEDKHNILLHLSIFYEYQQFFQHRICFSIQPPDYQWDKSRDYTCYSQWPVTHFSTFYQFILNMLFNHCQWLVYWCITKNTLWSYALVLNVRMGLRNDLHVLEFREIYFLITNIIMIIIHSTTNFFVNKYYLLYRLIFKFFLCCIKMS